MRPLFRLDNVEKRHPLVHRWFEKHKGPLGEFAYHWFSIMRQCGDDVSEVLHDDQPTACVGDAAFAYVDVFKAHVNVGFFQGAELPDPASLLQGTGKFMRHTKLKPEVAVDEASLTALIKSAYADVKRRLAAE